VGDSGESVVGPNFLNNIIGPNRQGWDRSGIRVYNQAFLYKKSVECMENGSGNNEF